jgi:hypothetical protein
MGISLTSSGGTSERERNTIAIAPFIVNCTVVPMIPYSSNMDSNFYGNDKVYLEQMKRDNDSEYTPTSNSYLLATPFSAKVNPSLRATGLLNSFILSAIMLKTKESMEDRIIKKRFRLFIYLPISIALITYLVINAYFQARGLNAQDLKGLENCYIDYSLTNGSKTGYLTE